MKKSFIHHPFLSLVSLTVTLLVALPIIGLGWGLWHPPPHPFLPQITSLGELFQQSHAWRLLINTTVLALSVSTLAGTIGLWFAWIEQRKRYPGRQWLAILDLLPLAVPSYLIAATLRDSLGPGGMMGHWLGLPVFKGFIPAIIVLTLVTVPYVHLLVSAALAKLAAQEEETAQCLGASRKKIFWQIIFPKLRPSFAFAWLISLLYIISDFGAVAVLDTQVLTWRLYQAVGHQQLAKATMLGGVLLLLALILLIIVRMVHGKLPSPVHIHNPRCVRRTRLTGAALWITYGLHALVIGLGVLLPVTALAKWVINGIQYQLVFASLWPPITDTLYVSIFSATVIVLLALAPAWMVGRQQLPRVIEQIIYMTSSLPGIMLAFGLLLWTLLVTGWLPQATRSYQWLLTSGILLFIGYAMRFMAEAYGGLKSAVILYDPRLGESARLLNSPRWRYLTKVMLPAFRPGLSAAWLLVLLALIKELPVTLLLGGPMGIRTLSFRIFDRYQEAFLHDVGAAGLVLVALSFVLVSITLRWRRHV
jgi:iron(III) transport system permease protein